MQHVQCASHFPKLMVHTCNCIVNKADTGVGFIVEVIEDVRIENEQRQDFVAAFERVIQACVIEQAKIAAEPENDDFFQKILTVWVL